MEGRFFLGLGTGENLNEHVVGQGWPSPDIRLHMLEEAVGVLKLLWKGEPASFHGCHFTVEDARLYSLPKQPPTLMIAASNPGAAELAGRVGDAMINTEVSDKLIGRFAKAGGTAKSRFVEMSVCWAENEQRARKTAHEVWALAGLEGMLFTELPTPALFESALKPISEEAVADAIICGPEPGRYVDKINKAARAGYTHICLHQVGPDQEKFIDFYQEEILPALSMRKAKAKRAVGTLARRARAARMRRRRN